MLEKSTEDLNNILKNNDDLDLDVYASLLRAQPYHNFVSYMDYLIESRELKRKDIILHADLPLKYGYKLLTGETRTSDRDKLIRLFIAMRMTNVECRRALSYYGLAPLYARLKRDIIIMHELKQAHGSVDRVNDRLTGAGEAALSASAY